MLANPFLQVEAPWGNLKLVKDDVAVLVVDSTQVHPKQLKQPIFGKAAYVMGIGRAAFPNLCAYVRVERLDCYEMRVDDLSPLAEIPELRHLAIRWNSKLENLSSIAKLKLRTLILEDTPKVRDLEPVAQLTDLEHLTFSAPTGSSANKVRSLAPLTRLPKLRELNLINTRVEADGLLPLANCRHLRKLSVSNQFPMEQYAFLSVRLPTTECSLFSSWIHQSSNEFDVMITGSRKPFLSSSKDKDRIGKYEKAFEAMRNAFSNNVNLRPEA